MPSPRSARALLTVVFALLGVLQAGWLARVPAVRDALGLSTGSLGVVLLVGALGALGATLVAGYLTSRFGGGLVLRATAVGQALAYAAIGVSTVTASVWLLVLGVTVQGASFALVNVTINVESAGVERRLGRTVMPQLHAMFSIGAVGGAGLAAALSHLGVPVVVHLVAAGAVGLVVQLACVTGIVHDTRPAARDLAPAVAVAPGPQASDPSPGPRNVPAPVGAGRAALSAWTERRTVLLGIVVFAAALSEGSANQWIPLAVVDSFASPEALGASTLTGFTIAMTLVRLGGSRLLDRFGRVAVLRASGLVSLAGLGLFVLAPTWPVALAGVVLWGAGAALVVPVTIAAASDDPLRAATRVAVVTAFTSIARLVAPPVVGALGELVGIREALAVIALGLVASVVLSREARPERPEADVVPAASSHAAAGDAASDTPAPDASNDDVPHPDASSTVPAR